MAQVREYSHWSAHVGFLSPSLYVQMVLVFLAPTHGWQEGHAGRGWGDFDVYTLFRALRRFPQRHQRQFDARRVFSYEKQKAGADFNFPPSLWQDLSMQGGSLWLRKLGASVVISEGTTHACRAGKG